MSNQFNNLERCMAQIHYISTGEVKNLKYLAGGVGEPHKKRKNLQFYPPKKIKNAPLNPANLQLARQCAQALLHAAIPLTLPIGSITLQTPNLPPLPRIPRKHVRTPPDRSSYLNRQTAHHTALLKAHRCARKLARCNPKSRLSEDLIQPLINAMNDVIQYHPELNLALAKEPSE